MFTGEAEAAMQLYTGLFDDGEVLELARWPEGGPGAAGTVLQAVFQVAGQRVRCADSPAVHDFTFTPSWSLFIHCDSAEQLDRLAAGLGEGGKALMPVGDYGFSTRFGWVQDRFGVSWQLNLA
jgi:predicted 3-demethylubiquinone-9 3-methyltransferase (glyoxalase superfamily)